MAGLNAEKSLSLIKKLLICILCFPLLIKGQNLLPTIFWDPQSPALHPEYWSKAVNVKIFQTLTFLCPNNYVNIVPFENSNTRSYYNLYVREVSPNDTRLDYDTICDTKQSRSVFSCNQTGSTNIDFTSLDSTSYRQLTINTRQANPKRDPSFTAGMDYIFFSTSNGRQDSLRTNSTKCTMVFRVHFCRLNEACAMPLCSTYGREEVCVAKSSMSDAPRDLHVTANTTSSLNISWKQPPNTDNAVAYYSICYRTNTSQACQTKMVEGHLRSAILKKLNSSTQYFIRVRAFSCKGPGNYSTEISSKTQDLPASTQSPKTTMKATEPTTEFNDPTLTSEPTALSSSSTTSSSVTIAWKAPDVIVGDVIFYSLCSRAEQNGSLGRDCRETIVEPTKLSAVIYNLDANTSYGIRVRAHSFKRRPGNYSKELIVRTDVSDQAALPQAQSSCSESIIDSVSLVIGIVIGAIAATGLSVLIFMATAKRRKLMKKPPTLLNRTNRGFRASVSGTNTIDMKNDKNLNCTMELNSIKTSS